MILTNSRCNNSQGNESDRLESSWGKQPCGRQYVCVSMSAHVLPLPHPHPPSHWGPQNMQGWGVMARIMVPWLSVSLVVFTKHCTSGTQPVSFSITTEPVMAHDLYMRDVLEVLDIGATGPANWFELLFYPCISSHADMCFWSAALVVSIVQLWQLKNQMRHSVGLYSTWVFKVGPVRSSIGIRSNTDIIYSSDNGRKAKIHNSHPYFSL